MRGMERKEPMPEETLMWSSNLYEFGESDNLLICAAAHVPCDRLPLLMFDRICSALYSAIFTEREYLPSDVVGGGIECDR